MPSGAKKRKAAKKKKEMEATFNPIANSSQGFKDVRSQDGKSSNGVVVTASSIYDHHKCHNPPSGSNGELEKNDASSVRSIVVEDSSVGIERVQQDKVTIHELGFEDNCVIEVEKKLISVEQCDNKSISSDSIESKNNYGKSDKNFTSSSEDESSFTVKNLDACTSLTNSFDDKPKNSLPVDAIQINEFTLVRENTNSLAETDLIANSVKTEVSVSGEKICLKGVAAVEHTVVSDIVAFGLKEDAGLPLSNLGDGSQASVTYPHSVSKEAERRVLALSEDCNHVKHLEGEIIHSSAAPGIDDSEIPRYFKSQTVASAPLVAQRTSLFSCCGLFDLFNRSDR